MCKDCDDWMVSGRLRRREVRWDFGNAPEVPKHRKKGGKKRVRQVSDHKHVYIWQKASVDYWWWTDSRWDTYQYICAEWGCGKVKKMRFDKKG